MSITLAAPTSEMPAGSCDDNSTAENAAELLEGTLVEDANENSDPIVAIRLKRPIEDAVQKFAALKGEKFDARVDADGDIYIPHGEFQIYMEAGDYEMLDDDGSAPDSPAGGKETNGATQPGPKPETDPLATPPAATPPAATPPRRRPPAAAGTMPPNSAAVPGQVPDGHYIHVASAFDSYQDDRREIERRMAELSLRVAELKREATNAKKAHEVATEELHELIESWESGKYERGLKAETIGEKNGQPTAATPENAAPAETPAETPAMIVTSDSGAAPTNPAAVDAELAEDMTAHLAREHRAQDRYNDVLDAALIGELGLQPRLEEKLVEVGVTTLLKLERLRKEIGLGNEKWPKGVGEAKITIIESAMSAWVARNTKLFQVEPEPGPSVGPVAPAGTPDSPATAAGPKITLPPAAVTTPAETPTIALPPTIPSGPSNPPVIAQTEPPQTITVNDL